MAPMGPDLSLSPSWEEILAQDPDHEKHLDTPEGRLEAVLNILKNGAMVLEVMMMDQAFRDYHEVTKAVNYTCGWGLIQHGTTADHLVSTISRVGAAARSDIDDKLWQLTNFGESIKPVIIYTWLKILEQGIDPVKALTSTSKIKKDNEGNFIVSAPYSRAKILIALASRFQMKEAELVQETGLTASKVRSHLKSLNEADLVNYKSVDPIDSYTFFKIIGKVEPQSDWPIYKDYRGYNQKKTSVSVEQAIKALILEGREEFTTADVISWIRSNIEDPGASIHIPDVNNILNFYCRQGVDLLKKSEFNRFNMSSVSLTDKGEFFTENVLKPLQNWAQNPNAVLEINQIRQELIRNPEAYKEILSDIARIYQDKSPYKNKDIDTKRSNIIVAVANKPGELTSNDIGRHLGISSETVRQIINKLIESGQVRVMVGKGRRKYLLMAGQEDFGQSVDKDS